jgi:nucleotide-binding universal stress UspA family protein
VVDVTYVWPPTYEISFMFRKILAPVDGSAYSMKALDVAIDFAKRYGSRVTALIVDDCSIDVEEVRKKVEDKAQAAGVNIEVKVIGKAEGCSVSSKIVKESLESDYDLIIIAARGRTQVEDILIGSTALSTIVNTTISVLLIR